MNELQSLHAPNARFPRYPHCMNDIDEIDGPKARGPLSTGKFPVITGENRSEPDAATGSRSVKGRLLTGNNANPYGWPKGLLNQLEFVFLLLYQVGPAQILAIAAVNIRKITRINRHQNRPGPPVTCLADQTPPNTSSGRFQLSTQGPASLYGETGVFVAGRFALQEDKAWRKSTPKRVHTKASAPSCPQPGMIEFASPS